MTSDRHRLLAAAGMLVIIASWVVVDAVRGNWGRVVFGVVFGLVGLVLIQAVTRPPKDPGA